MIDHNDKDFLAAVPSVISGAFTLAGGELLDSALVAQNAHTGLATQDYGMNDAQNAHNLFDKFTIMINPVDGTRRLFPRPRTNAPAAKVQAQAIEFVPVLVPRL